MISQTEASRIRDEVKSIAKRNEILANEYRTLILAALIVMEEATWGDLKKVLENIFGYINPNTLAFHINKLAEANFIIRYGSPRSPIYRANVTSQLKEELRNIVELLSRAMKRR